MDELVIDSALLLAQGRIIYSHPFNRYYHHFITDSNITNCTAGTMTTLAGERALK